MTLLIFMGVGFAFGITRMLLGLGTVTNLDNHNPWGIWIAFDVACGVALAAGGFTTAALVDIFGQKKYNALLRPAILTAFLGYLWVAIALSFDLGRYWNIWRPIFNWQGNSVLFEVGMCVTAYLMVLSVEMSPAFLEGLKARIERKEWGAALLRKVEKPILALYAAIKIVLPMFIVAGVVLSFMHQSSLGTLDADRPHEDEHAVEHPHPPHPVPAVGDHGGIPDGHPGIHLRQHQFRPQPGDGTSDADGPHDSLVPRGLRRREDRGSHRPAQSAEFPRTPRGHDLAGRSRSCWASSPHSCSSSTRRSAGPWAGCSSPFP